MQCTFRTVDWRDAAYVMPVMESAFDPVYGEAWSQSQLVGLMTTTGSWLVALDVDGAVAGFAMVRFLLDEAELMLLAIAPSFRGQGFGRKLLDEVIEESKRRNILRIFLEMRSDNESALLLYEGAGFHPIGKRRGYYRGFDGILRDAITMSRLVHQA